MGGFYFQLFCEVQKTTFAFNLCFYGRHSGGVCKLREAYSTHTCENVFDLLITEFYSQ
ncbi:MAG: hypothetical protein JWN14_3503 [Chthonomonadales bacterium]|nr:hypothetical protein [Chthonomonadales bacterium]